jgi:hypothetical protein
MPAEPNGSVHEDPAAPGLEQRPDLGEEDRDMARGRFTVH